MSPTTIAAFVGSSISVQEASRLFPNINFYSPIKRGDLDKVDADTYCIVDGVFHQSLSVSPQEIKRAIERGKTVIGASSMGALRAVECYSIGMIGIGRIFEMYFSKQIQDDDEVAILMDPDNYTQVSDSLVDIRCFFHDSPFNSRLKELAIGYAKSIHYSHRSIEIVANWLSSNNEITSEVSKALVNVFKSEKTQKFKDAIMALGSCQILNESYASTGTRSRSLTETWNLIEPLLESCGVTRVADITGLDNLNIPVFQAFRPASSYPVSVFSGKGLTSEQSKIGAAMEAIESYVVECVTADKMSATVGEMASQGKSTVDLKTLAIPHSINKQSNRFNWIEMKKLSGETIWLPQECTLMPCPERQWNVTTNGIASGSTFAEAILHGALEVIERDALSIALVTCQANAAHSIYLGNPTVKSLINKIEAAGLVVLLKDVTSDLKIPTFYCVIKNKTDSAETQTWAGCGSHFNPIIAINRALTEAAQSHTCFIAGSREDLEERFQALQSTNNSNTSDIFSYWYNQIEGNGGNNSELYRIIDGDANFLLNELQKVLAKNNLEIIFKDFSPALFPVSVVRVVIPGLEAFSTDKTRVGERLFKKQPLLKELFQQQNKGEFYETCLS